MDKGLAFFCCEYCNKKYRLLDKLHKHYEKDHNGKKPKEEPKQKTFNKPKPKEEEKEEQKNTVECSICLTEIKERGCAVPCGHTSFCLICLESCGDTCPICRREIGYKIKCFF